MSTSLHALFALRNPKGFQRHLDACRLPPSSSSNSALSSSGGRSWTKSSNLPIGDVNARDRFGRTVLHLACSSLDPAAITFVRLLLAHPGVNVNLQDTESSWTALHRALYVGNIAASLLLIQRPDTDLALKDMEGYTAFDVFNSTVQGTKPLFIGSGSFAASLLTWGTNRNAALGVGDGNDRAFPEQIVLRRQGEEHDKTINRLLSADVKDISMAKLHTTVVTTDKSGNLRSCGFGSGGRLGPGRDHTQYNLTPLSNFTYSIIQVAPGHDHTLALTSSGEIISWGMNRFAQLGYVVEVVPSSGGVRASSGPGHEVIQTTPRKIQGALKKVPVGGVCACKTASGCWSKDGVMYTWGTNSGQLGYSHTAHPVQILPRIVSSFSMKIVSASITDTAMACLLENHDVMCFWNDVHFKINFPTNRFPLGFNVYRPPHSLPKAAVSKITSCEQTFGALTSMGEVFSFTLPKPPEVQDKDTPRERISVKPHLIWELRKKFTAVTDLALGSEGSVILSTESGHVFVRGPRPLIAGGKNSSRFSRVPFLQRVVKVASNGAGAYAALRVDAVPEPLVPGAGGRLQDHIRKLLPFLSAKPMLVGSGIGLEGEEGQEELDPSAATAMGDPDEDTVEMDIQSDVSLTRTIMLIITEDGGLRKQSRSTKSASNNSPATKRPPTSDNSGGGQPTTSSIGMFHGLLLGQPAVHALFCDPSEVLGTPAVHGADLLVVVKRIEIPVHRTMLAARSQPLLKLFGTRKAKESIQLAPVTIQYSAGMPTSSTSNARQKKTKLATATAAGSASKSTVVPTITFNGCEPLSVFIALQYLYTDDVAAVWDRRIGLHPDLVPFANQLKATQVKSDLRVIARMLDLPRLAAALEVASKRTIVPCLGPDLWNVFVDAQKGRESIERESVAMGGSGKDVIKADIVLELAEGRKVYAHSPVLRARCPFFEAFLGDEDWTVERWDVDGVMSVDMQHLEWRPMEFVLKYLYSGEDEELFTHLEFVNTVDEFTDFLFTVIATANELLIDKFMLTCSSLILRHTSIYNVCSLLVDATHYNALALAHSLRGYMSRNLELLLENRLLEDLPTNIICDLAKHVREDQESKSPMTRGGKELQQLMERNEQWIAMQDWPAPILRDLKKAVAFKESASSTSGHAVTAVPTAVPLSTAPSVAPTTPLAMTPVQDADDGHFFSMDDDKPEVIPPLTLEQQMYIAPIVSKPSSSPPAATGRAWTGKGVQVAQSHRADLKAIIAEAESNKPALPRRMPSEDSSELLNKTKTSQRERRKYNTFAEPDPQLSALSARLAESPRALPTPSAASQPTSTSSQSLPWRTPKANGGQGSSPWRTPTGTASVSVDPTHSPPSVFPLLGSNRASSSSQVPPVGQATASTPPQKNLVITPQRASPGSIRRRGSAEVAWSAPPPHIPRPQASPSAGLSFTAIQQQQQLLQTQGTPVKARKSLTEIQAEEQARQTEDDFLKWWTAEEAKVKEEEGARMRGEQDALRETLARSTTEQGSRGGKKDKRPGRGRGGGRGGRGGQPNRTPAT